MEPYWTHWEHLNSKKTRNPPFPLPTPQKEMGAFLVHGWLTSFGLLGFLFLIVLGTNFILFLAQMKV
jgi:hypothetical protein